ncbi:MAG TPA: hypothetical protein VFS64_02740 [Solirubrobacterales bacterium]|nr:hypothetical protein [Solirubrobacterales bacterium]
MDEVSGLPQGEAVGRTHGRLERAVFETDRQLIEGDMTLPPAGYQSRFSDWLNRDKAEFLSLTDAKVTTLEDGEAILRPFLVLSKRHIRVAYPCDA